MSSMMRTMMSLRQPAVSRAMARSFSPRSFSTGRSSIIGIDLGTTNSCVAVMEAGKARVIINDEGKKTTPSIVAFTSDGGRLVGEPARRQIVTNPHNTFHATKRLIGRRFDDEATTKDRKNLPYSIVKSSGGDAWLEAFGKQYSPSQIGAIVLGKMKQTAESYLDHSVSEAVITVPAYFNDQQRQATRDAGRIAGLNVRRIINEPTAAALHYGVGDEADNKDSVIAVYDLGGGTFDVSILSLDNQVFQVMSTNGDTALGGEDFDHAIVDLLADRFKAKTGTDLKKDIMALQRLREAAENAKKELDQVEVVEINLPYITMADGNPTHLEDKLTKKDFEALIKPLVARTEGPCKKAMEDAKVSTGQIRQVLLVGGMTRTPAVQELVQNIFGRAPSKSVNPDEVVASGAAVQGAVLAGDVKDVVLIDVTPLSLGTSNSTGEFVRIIKRNTAIPAKHSKKFTTTHDGQTSINCQVLQGEREMAKDNKLLGEFLLPGIPPARRGVPSIEIEFSIDASGIVTATASDAGTGIKRDIRVATSGGLSDSEVERMIKDAEIHAEKDKFLREIAQARNVAETLIYSTESSLSEFADKVTEDMEATIKEAMEELRQCLSESAEKEEQDEKEALELLKDATEKLQQEAFKIGDAMYGKASSSGSSGEGEGEKEGDKKSE